MRWAARLSLGLVGVAGVACSGEGPDTLGTTTPETPDTPGCVQDVDCDGQACMTAVCEAEVCTLVPDDGATCDDGDACTDGDACADGACVGAAVDCDDGDACNGVETCDRLTGCEPGLALDCSDWDGDCAVGTCADGECRSVPTPGVACDDGDACSEADTCDDLGACTGTDVVCDDGIACSVDSCDPVTGCAADTSPCECLDDAGCDDGDGCNGAETCGQDGSCVLGTAVDCSGLDGACAQGVCGADGTCEAVAKTGDACDDGSACTTDDVCASDASCVGAAITCDDGVPCTVDSCDDTTGCVVDVTACDCLVDADCDDGIACTGTETCGADGSCVAGTPIDCSELDGACVLGQCSGDAVCEAVPQPGLACDDGDACSEADACDDAGACAGTAVICDDGIDCTVDSCDAATGCVVDDSACEADPCDALVYPDVVPFTILPGFTTSEDFAFSPDGKIYSNDNASLVWQNKAGDKTLYVPNVGHGAGMAMLPGGDLVHAIGDGLYRYSDDGSSVALLNGLEYPNGLDLDENGFIFVAEQAGGRIRKVDPDTGEFEIIAEGLCNPNGVSFGPGYDRVYVGSFGCGVVYAIDKDPSGIWEPWFEFGKVEGALEDPTIEPPPDTPEWCIGLEAGDYCYDTLYDTGECAANEAGDMVCQGDPAAPGPTIAVCQGKTKDDPCSFTAGGYDFTGTCQKIGSFVHCAADDVATCAGYEAGEYCPKVTWGQVYFGKCESDGEAPLTCTGNPGPDPNVGGNGLDGINVDACGWVYVTEFVAGRVWRFAPDGGTPMAVTTGLSLWIPNMHWGPDAGGWDPEVLYVSDRQDGHLFELQIGVLGKETTKP